MRGKESAYRKPKADRPEGDFYITPISLFTKLYRAESIPFGSDILEPFCGKKYLVNYMENCGFNTTSFDLYYGRKKQDFLKYTKKHKSIISNPPFSQFDDMVMHSKEIAENIYLIGKMNFWGAFKRNQRGVWKHLKKIYVFDRQVDYRTPYRKDGHFHVGNLVTGWFCWDMNYTGLSTIQPMEVNKYATLGAHPDSRKLINEKI